eukprot:XP_001704745.1 Hypothetical protein GL50803_28278 [Giardia lamblia ATCC 50803]
MGERTARSNEISVNKDQSAIDKVDGKDYVFKELLDDQGNEIK